MNLIYFSKKIFQIFFLIVLVGFSSQCIHFKVGEYEPQKAHNLTYTKPDGPFILTKNSDVDSAWQSRTTGNIISYSTNCSKIGDKQLTNVYLEISKGFDRIDTNTQNSLFYNGREALRGTMSGAIDGILVSMDFLIFNKNQCFYQLTYSGLTDTFSSEKIHFDQFIKEFKAP